MKASQPVQISDVDQRLAVLSGRTVRLQALIDHDVPGAGKCPSCGWAVTPTRRDCPSRTVALCLLDGKPLPSWMAHLADRIPGARPARPAMSEDELAGLFPAPPRTPQRRTS